MTIGILTQARNRKEAESIAKKRLKDKELNYCCFEQTDLEPTYTEESKVSLPDSEVLLKIPEKVRKLMASRLQKNESELTTDDYRTFLQETIEKTVEKK
jgi:hypothetical protein